MRGRRIGPIEKRFLRFCPDYLLKKTFVDWRRSFTFKKREIPYMQMSDRQNRAAVLEPRPTYPPTPTTVSSNSNYGTRLAFSPCDHCSARMMISLLDRMNKELGSFAIPDGSTSVLRHFRSPKSKIHAKTITQPPQSFVCSVAQNPFFLRLLVEPTGDNKQAEWTTKLQRQVKKNTNMSQTQVQLIK